MKKLMLSTTVIIATATAAYAQEITDPEVSIPSGAEVPSPATGQIVEKAEGTERLDPEDLRELDLEPIELTAENLTGARVYDAEDAWIGEVDRLILGDDGAPAQAIVDVGGFLGLGEKPVALPMEEVDFVRVNDGQDLRMEVPMTKEELEALPTFGS